MKKKRFIDGVVDLSSRAPKEKSYSPRRIIKIPTIPSLSDEDIDKLANRIAGKVSTFSSTLSEIVDNTTLNLVQIDETLIDTGIDISKIQSDDLVVQEEEKVDDIKKAKEKLSKLKRGK